MLTAFIFGIFVGAGVGAFAVGLCAKPRLVYVITDMPADVRVTGRHDV